MTVAAVSETPVRTRKPRAVKAKTPTARKPRAKKAKPEEGSVASVVAMARAARTIPDDRRLAVQAFIEAGRKAGATDAYTCEEVEDCGVFVKAPGGGEFDIPCFAIVEDAENQFVCFTTTSEILTFKEDQLN